jgi:hypothetical protein
MMDVCGYQFLLNAFAKFIEVMIIRYWKILVMEKFILFFMDND